MSRQATDDLYIELGYFTPEEYYVYVAEAESEISASAELTVTIGVIKEFDCDFGALFTPNIDATGFKNHTASLDSEFTVIVSSVAIRDSSATLENIINLSAQGDKFIFGDADLSSEFTQTTDPAIVITIEATIADSFVLIVDSTRIQDGDADLTDEFALVVETTVEYFGDADLTDEFALNATAEQFKSTNADLSDEFTVSALVLRIIDFTCNFGALFTPTVDAVAIINSVSVIDSAFTIQIQGDKTSDTDADLSAVFSQTADVNLTADAQFDGEMFTQLSADALKIKEFDGDLSSEFAASANAIEYIRKSSFPRNRPKNWYVNLGSISYTERTTGNYGVILQGGQLSRLRCDEVNINEFPMDGNSFLLEFWAYLPSISNATSHTIVMNLPNATVSGGGWELIYRDGGSGDPYSGRYLVFQWRRDSNSGTNVINVAPTTQLPINTWSHIAVRFKPYVDASTVNFQILLNGSVIQEAVTVSTTSFNTSGGLQLANAASSETRYDEFHLKQGNNSGNFWDISYPNTPTNDQNNSLILSLFEQNLLDYNPGTYFGEGNLTSQFTVNAGIGGTFGVSADLESLAGITATGDKFVESSSNLSAETELSIEYTRIQTVDSTQASEFTIEINTLNSRLVDASIDPLSSEFSIGAEATKIIQYSADLPTIASQLTAASKIGDFLIASDVAAQLSVDAEITRTVESTISAEFTTQAIGYRIQEFSADLSVEFNQTTQPQITADGTGSLSSEFAQQTEGERYRDTNITLTGIALLEASASGIIPLFPTELTSLTQATATGLKILQLSSDSSDQFSLTAEPIKAVFAESSLQSEYNLATEFVRTREYIADLPTVASQLSIASKIGDYLVDCSVSAELIIDANIIPEGQAILTSVASLNTDPVALLSGEIDINTTTLLNITAIVGVVGEGAFSVETDLTAAPNYTVDNTADLQTITQLSVDPVVIRSAQGTLNTVSILELNLISRTLQFSADFGALFTPVMSFGLIADGGADLSMSFAFAAQGRIIITTQTVYKIPRENTSYTVERETRTHTVTRESRVYAVEGN